MITDFVLMKNYQVKKPFTSFLPGIAGLFGRPLWTFYTNRGQLMMSFGFKDKNGAIQEFFPANAGYMYERVNGFKTFIKVDGKFYSFFQDPNEHQELKIYKDRVSIKETNHLLGISVKITYFTIPNESVSALARLVEISNHQEPRLIEVLDGLTQMLPCGIDYGGYKAVSNLLQSWMDVDIEPNYAFYKLRGSTADSTIVNEVVDGNFFISKIDGQTMKLVADIKKVFEHDTNFQTPHGFINGLNLKDQVTVNQVPCAYSYYHGEITKKLKIQSIFGYASNKEDIEKISRKVNKSYLNKKLIENQELIEEVLQDLEVETSYPLFDAYLKQSLLDNLLRGGKPYPFQTKSGLMSYHLYSRKHGDPERDYNFFTLEPKYFSQGNGNFRDVLQNRRNDNIFYPHIKDFNIKYFGSTIQPDGYNPLSIEGVKFRYQGSSKYYQNNLPELFTPGEAFELLKNKGLSNRKAYEELLSLLNSSTYEQQVNYGEGFWQDHFTYVYDLIENYLRIYPDSEEDLLFNDMTYPFFQSPIKVRPRSEKTFLMPNGKIRQHEAIAWVEGVSKWASKDGNILNVNLASKLLTLILNKYALLDSDNLGIMYEADRPGWNDALNGLPGVFGSGIGETIELLRLTRYFNDVINIYDIKELVVIKPLIDLMSNLGKSQGKFNLRLEAVEEYREQLFNLDLETVQMKIVRETISKLLHELEKSFTAINSLGEIIPTYLTYEVVDYQELQAENTKYGKRILPLSYRRSEVTPFLEAPARSLKIISTKEALNVYNKIKKSDIYDHKLKMYKTSGDLDSYTHDLGRIRMFTKGWLERESNFLHMNYKYLLGLIKSGLYEQYYEEIFDNFVCFMDMDVYGRSVLENSSFIATSNNPDPKNHGRGFVSRLSGSTAELLSMYSYMFLGYRPFIIVDSELRMEFKPIIHSKFFLNDKVSFRFYQTKINYINKTGKSLYNETPSIIEVIYNNEVIRLDENYLNSYWAKRVRDNDVIEINVYFQKS